MTERFKWLSVSLCAFGVLSGSLLLGILGGSFAKHIEPTPDMSYSDFIVIILTAFAVILAALTLFIGIFAFLGWTTISRGALQKAEQIISKELVEGGELYSFVVKRLKEIEYSGVSPLQMRTTVMMMKVQINA